MGPGNEMDCGFSIAVSRDGTSVYAAGFATVPGEGADIWIRKYCVDILPPVGSPGPCPTTARRQLQRRHQLQHCRPRR